MQRTALSAAADAERSPDIQASRIGADMGQQARRRFLSDFYDSVRQRAYPFVMDRIVGAGDTYCGRLRFDSLVSQTLVLVDTQVLDGELFLDTGPQNLASSLTRSEGGVMPIEIKSRAGTLEESLLAFFRRPHRTKLVPFAVSLVRDDATRSEVMRRFDATDSEKLKSWRDLLVILREAEVPEEDVERIEAGWNRWFEAESRGLVVLKRWEGQWDLDAFLGSVDSLRECLQTESGGELARWTWEHRGDRSAVDTRLNEVSTDWEDERALLDVVSIRSWFNSGYNRTLSSQHRCDAFESVDMSPALLRTLDEGDEGYEAVQLSALDLPGHFLEKLGTMPSSGFREFCWKQRDNLENWWGTGSTDALKRIACGLSTACLQCETPARPLGTRLAAIGGVAAGGWALGAAAGTVEQLAGTVLGAMAPKAFFWCEEKLAARPLSRTAQRVVQIAEERAIQHGSTNQDGSRTSGVLEP